MAITGFKSGLYRRSGVRSAVGRWLLTAMAAAFLASACFSDDSPEEPRAETPARPAIASGAASPVPSPRSQPTPAQVAGPVTLTYSLPFVWPADGPLTSVMGPEHPSGIDIGLDAGGSLAVRAASSGTVTSAGGSDDDALGIAVVIDHGGGITTTYGHLAELSVRAGEKVVTGQVLGTGGATGNATGVHLHFEIRKDGQTVDPLDVLQTDAPDTATQRGDCDSDPFTLPAGSLAWFDLSRLLAPGEQIVATTARAWGGDSTVAGDVEDGSIVALRIPADFRATRSEELRIEFTIDNPSGNRSVGCRLLVEHTAVATTFYARAAGFGHEEPLPVAPPTPTPTPTPRSTLEPQYATPVVGNPSAAPPDVRPPAVSTPVILQPNYGAPPASP